mgnify:CR=1 FL=1
MSGVFVVTGALGGGKTLWTVQRAVKAVQEGRKVATNVNLFLGQFTAKKSSKTYLRLPDHPTLRDLQVIGRGCPEGTPEEKFGVLMLDECAHFFNAQSWNNSDTLATIQYMTHMRKLGWEVYFIIQDISVLNKQMRVSFAEHIVYCTRTDRFGIPLVSAFLKQALDIQMKLPKVHTALIHARQGVRYTYAGLEPFRASFAHGWYNTYQIFDSEYSDGVYSVLPNKYKRRAPKARGLSAIMRLTKIYFAKHKITSVMLATAAATFAATYIWVVMPTTNDYKKQLIAVNEQVQDMDTKIQIYAKKTEQLKGTFAAVQDEVKPQSLVFKLAYDGFKQFGAERTFYFKDGEMRYTSEQLASMGYSVKDRGCSALIVDLATLESARIPVRCV